MRLTNEMAKKLRSEFPVFRDNEGLVYLDSAATSQMPESVIETMCEHFRHGKANVGRGVYALNLKTTEKYARARGAVAKFINADPNEIVFVRNATEGINLLSRTVGKFLNGTNIVLTDMEHHSNLLPWQQLAKRRGFELRFIGLNDDYTLNLDDAEKKIDSGTALVALSHVSNVLGTVNDLTEFIELAKDVGAVTVVDAAQSVGHIPVDVEDINCDYLVFSGHKLFGPTGIGVLYGVKDLLDEMQPFMEGGGMVAHATQRDAEWQYPPLKFEAGTPNICGALGLAKAIEFASRVGVEQISHWNKELVSYCFRKLKEVPNVTIHAAEPIINSGVVSFTVAGMHPHDVASLLSDSGVCVRSGHHCCMPLMQTLGLAGGTVRASFYPYNTFEDVDVLVSGVKAAQDIFHRNHNEMYQEEISYLYKHPKNFGALTGATHKSHSANASCGDELFFNLIVADGVVKDVKFTGQGCAISVASASLFSEAIKGKSLREIEEMGADYILRLLKVSVNPARMKCALLPLESVRRALQHSENNKERHLKHVKN